jgi:RNA polymerase sigma-70 factor (ECF subfamily)
MADEAGRNHPSDEQLAEQAQAGCALSLDRLLRRHQVPLLHFLRYRGPAADAEDALQETLLRALTNLHRYRRHWLFRTWLFTIARRVSINRRRRRQPACDEDALRSAATGAASALELLAAEDSRRGLWDVAARVLSEEQSTALWLRYVENLRLGEVAAVLGQSRNAVKVQLFRARKKLLPALRRLGYGPPPVRQGARE